MSLRIIGAIVTLLGAFLAVSSLWALSLSNPLAPPGSPGDLSAQQWLLHWRLWGWVTLVLGLVIGGGGIGVFFLKRWSFLLVFVVARSWSLSCLGYSWQQAPRALLMRLHLCGSRPCFWQSDCARWSVTCI
jgi:hypothetical protein